MPQLGHTLLEDTKMSQSEHKLRIASSVYKTIAAIQVPFDYTSPGDNDHIEVHVRFDITGSDLPLLDDHKSLRAMMASLNFWYTNRPVVVNKIICRVDLVKWNS